MPLLGNFFCNIRRRRILKISIILLIVIGALLLGYRLAYPFFPKLLWIIDLVIDVRANKLHQISLEELALNKCPACFGVNDTLCGMIQRGEIRVRKNYPWSEAAEKNVMHGIWNSKNVVLKSLARTDECEAFDKKICNSAGLSYPCDVQSAIWRSFLNPAKPLKRAITNILDCPSDRYIKKMKAKYGSGDRDVLLAYEKAFLLNTLSWNQEPVILQVFPSEEGWPFPKYYGACGRVIIAEYVGETLEQFLYKPWPVRAQLAVKLLELAQQLTTNHQDWGIYMLDASLSNFAVSANGDVKLIDAEHVIVVDLKDLKSAPAQSTVNMNDLCDLNNKPDCLIIAPEELCQGRVRDLNYLAICKGVLADHWLRVHVGLLHSPPALGGLSVKVRTAVENCVKPQFTNRETAVKHLIKLLKVHSEGSG